MNSYHLHTKSIQADHFCQLLEVGDMVLTHGYGEIKQTTIGKVAKVNLKSIYVDFPHRKYYDGQYRDFNSIKRLGYECIKLLPAQITAFKQAVPNLQLTNPEHFI